MTSISALYTPDAVKATQLYKTLAKGTPSSVRNTLKMNSTLSNQLLFVTNGTIGVLTFPILTTDKNNRPCLIGTFGNDTDNLAPTAIPGDLLHQSISALVPTALATKYDLPVLAADPLTLEPPPPSTVGAGPDRLHYIFTDPTFAPVIAVLPATFSVPIGILAPLGWDFSTPEISEAAFPCEAGRAWIKSVTHLLTHHAGQSILSDPSVFTLTDLDLSPFTGHDLVPLVSTDYAMLNPTEEQYGFVLAVAREAITARRQAGSHPVLATESPNAALERQARVMNDIVKAAIASPGPAIKEVQSRTDRETHKAIQDAVARYQLMFAGLTTTADPTDSDVKTITVDLPAISDVFKEILDTTKVSEAVRMTQEQFTYYLAQRSTSKKIHDASMNYDAKALDAPKVTALKRAHWADRPLSIEPDSIKDKLGIYHFAPPRIGSYEYEQRIANGCKIFRQEIVGEDKSRIIAKAHDLDHTGKMDSDTDLHSTIANFSAIATFITKHATQSELWKMIDALHSVWLHPDGRVWLSHHLSSHKYIVTAIVLQFQHVVGLYVKIANSLEYRRAVIDGKQIDPRAYETANGQARHIIATMNNMIPGMTLGPFVIEPVACGLFHPKDRVTKDKRQPDKKPKDDPAAARTSGRTDGPRNGSGRRDDGRTTTRDNPRTDTRSPNAPPDLPAARITTLKAAGLVKYSGPGRVPHPVDILELNGSSGLTRICMMYITRERFCRYEDNCKQKHIKRMADFTPENKTKFQNFIQNHTHFQMATTGTTP